VDNDQVIGRARLATQVAAFGAIALGILVRLGLASQQRALWLDESKLALNLAGKSAIELLQPLDFEQLASIPYRLLAHAAVVAAGASELSLRLVPLLAGVATLFVMWPLASRILEPAGSVLALYGAAIANYLVEYSVEGKPYAVDVLASCLFLGAAWRFLLEKKSTLLRFAVIGAACAFSSVAAPLFLAPAVLLWAARALRERRWRELGRMGLVASAWCALIAANLSSGLKSDAARNMMQRCWDKAFLWGPNPPMRIAVAAREVLGNAIVGEDNTSNVLLWLLAVLVTLGCIRLARRVSGAALLLVAGPIGPVLAASLLRVYPIAGRTCLFLVPSLLLLMVEGLTLLGALLCAAGLALWQRQAAIAAPSARSGVAGFVIAAGTLLLVSPTHAMLRRAAAHRARDWRMLPTKIVTEGAADDVVYVNARGVPTWFMYTTDWQREGHDRVAWLARNIGVDGPAYENAPPRGRPVGRDEGAELETRWQGRRVVLGLPSGSEWRFPYGLRKVHDSGFIERETARIMATKPLVAWVCWDHDIEDVRTPLVRSLTAAGYRVEETVQRGHSGIVRLRRLVGIDSATATELPGATRGE
jgi:hypothetical protein